MEGPVISRLLKGHLLGEFFKIPSKVRGKLPHHLPPTLKETARRGGPFRF